MLLNCSNIERELARRCMTFSDLRPGVSPTTIKKVQRGLPVRSDAAGRIARALNVSIDQITEGGDH